MSAKHLFTTALRPTTTLASRPCSLSYAPRRHASSSFSLASLRGLLPGGRRTAESTTPEDGNVAAAVAPEKSKGLFDVAVEEEDVRDVVVKRRGDEHKQATFHKSSTANFKTSRRKLNDLGRLIAGRTADEAVLQLKVSPKKQASRLLSMVALARDHAIAKGLSRDKLVIAQSWVTQGPSLKRLDIKGRGRYGVKHHPSSKLHVLLAEGDTAEEKRRQHKRNGWRASVRGLTEGDGVGIGRSKPIINSSVGGWKW